MLRARCAKRARSVHGHYRVLRPHVMYVFGISTTNAVIWNMFYKDWRTFLKNCFLIQGVLLWFLGSLYGRFLAEGGANFEKKWGTNKIEIVSTCLRNTHVHGELEIPKFYFVAPPNTLQQNYHNFNFFGKHTLFCFGHISVKFCSNSMILDIFQQPRQRAFQKCPNF